MSGDATGLKFPKIPVLVEVGLATGEAAVVELYVAEHVAHGYRQQLIEDLLSGAEPFLPARDVSDDTVHLLGVASIAWVSIPLADGSLPVEEEPETDEPELFEEKHRVRIELADGARFEGELLYSPPADQARVIDHLNGSSPYVRLWQNEQIILIRKRVIQRLVELTEA